MADMTHNPNHHEEEIHLPEPSIWPLILAIGASLLPVAGILFAAGSRLAPAVGGAGALIAIVSGIGWAMSVIRDKATIDIAWGNETLSSAWKLFLISEAAIFGAFFGHYGYMIYKADGAWPPAGTPHIHLLIPALGTIILVTSSVTCELGHKALLVGRRSLSKTWILVTILLGLLFIALQGFEWGLLQTAYNFYPNTNVFGTLFYLITGFHGFHVITGLLLLVLVYARLEMGSFTTKRHFSMNAASWYWHFVDVIWIFVFFVIYIGSQPLE